MNTFWHWLMKANGKRVFLAAVLALVCVSAYWAWRELSPLDDGSLSVPAMTAGEKAQADLGLLSFLERIASGHGKVSDNLFLPSMRAPLPPPVRDVFVDAAPPEPPDGALPHMPVLTQPPKPLPRPPEPEPPKPRPPKPRYEKVSLVYRGILRNPDNRIMALIEDSHSGAARFYHAGESLFGVTLSAFRPNRAYVVLRDGSTAQLKLDEVFEGGIREL